MNFTSILEQIIAGTISALLSAGILFLISKVGGKKVVLRDPNSEFKITSLSLFSILLFITSFFGIFTLISFYYQWTNFTPLTIITIVFGILSSLAYQKQCPNCKSVFGNRRTNWEILKKEEKPYRYRDLTIYYYSDGVEKNRKYGDVWHTKMETIETRKDFFECECGHKWWGAPYEVNLDINARPKPNKKYTHFKNPDGLEGSI